MIMAQKMKLEFHSTRLPSEGQVSLVLGFLKKSKEYQRKW